VIQAVNPNKPSELCRLNLYTINHTNFHYLTREDSRPDFNELSAFIGSTIPDTETELEYLLVAPDDPELARLDYEALTGLMPMYPDLPNDRFVIWARLSDGSIQKAKSLRFIE
jgi:predicted nucleic acid-binding protein